MTPVDVNVLVVEDNQEKLKAFVELLLNAGVQRGNVDVAQHGLEAREKLRNSYFDVMLLDLALPMRPEDEPNRNGGLDLLEELDLRAGYIRPGHIVGVTAYEELSTQFEREFEDRMVYLLQYDPSSERWENQLRRLLTDVADIRATNETTEYRSDVCIVTALRDPELSAVKNLPYQFSTASPLDAQTYYHQGTLTTNGGTYSVLASAAPRVGLVAAALHAQKVVQKFRPRILAMVGICAGVPSRTNIGDVILANPAWEWQSGKAQVQDGSVKFLSEPHQLDVDQRVVARFLNLSEDNTVWVEAMESYRGPKPGNLPRGLVGPVASGSLVVADDRTLSEITDRQHRKLVGLEMETYAVYAAAREFPVAQPVVLSLKAVSDFADSAKSDNFQAYAASNSAWVLHHFLTNYIDELVC